MVQATITEQTPNLIPVPPDWVERRAASPNYTNRNINDIFWKKGPREADPGWIVVGPSTIKDLAGKYVMGQAERWLRKGRVPLYEYSVTNRVDKNGAKETIETNLDHLGTTARFYWLFVNGGAGLFPIEQIIEHHWHITPPFGLTTDVFPQLREWEAPEPWWCAACASPTVPLNSEEQLVTHLQIGHRQTLVQARDLVRSYDPHERPRGRQGLQLRRRAQVVEDAIEKQESKPVEQVAKRLVICDDCGAQFGHTTSLMWHRRKNECPAGASQPVDAMYGQAESVTIDA